MFNKFRNINKLFIQICSDGVDFKLAIAGHPLKCSFLNQSSSYNKEDVNCTVVGSMPLWPFIDPDTKSRKLPLMPILFTRKALSWKVSTTIIIFALNFYSYMFEMCPYFFHT